MLPDNIQLHLVSSLDEVEARLAHVLHPLEGKRVLVIDDARRAEGRHFGPEDLLPLSKFGAISRLFSLEGASSADLGAALEASDVCLLLGGNTFVLQHLLDQADFTSCIARSAAKRNARLHVVGESAGAVVMGSGISHVASMDDPSLAPEGVEKGLGWIDACIVPHRGCPHWGFGEKVEQIIAAHGEVPGLLILHETELKSFELGR